MASPSLISSNVDEQQSKTQLRRVLIEKRRSLSVAQWREKSELICSHLQASPLFAQAGTILAYFSFRQEPDLSLLFRNAKYRWGFPRCVEKSLGWHIWQPGEPLQLGAYGIFEPCPDSPILQPNEVDLILIPAVACDRQGYRLGYGGGFYDRMLSSAEWSAKPTIGLVFEFAYLNQLPINSWDKSLKAVCTEAQLQIITT